MTGTPTAVPFPPTVDFPNPQYEAPTSIPLPEFPDIPNPDQGIQLTPFAMPSPFTPTVTAEAFQTPAVSGPTAVPLNSISSTIPLSYTTPLTLGAAAVTGSVYLTTANTLIGGAGALISDVVSYTAYISGVTAAINPTGTFTIASAPAWYAPELPREMADIGWTFETLGQDETARYSYSQWAWFVGYMASLPFQLLKSLWALVLFAGPLGLVLAWLLVMFPIVLFFKFFNFIKNLIISLLNFVIKIIRLIGDIWDMIPFA